MKGNKYVWREKLAPTSSITKVIVSELFFCLGEKMFVKQKRKPNSIQLNSFYVKFVNRESLEKNISQRSFIL